MRNDSLALLWILSCSLPLSSAWTTSSMQRHHSLRLFSSSSAGDEFAAFAASLEEDEPKKGPQKTVSTTSSTTATTARKSWQDDLDKLLDPTTPFAKRQVLLQDLLSANGEIRSAVEAALRDRKIDPLLTPRSKRLQEGSRAVARQLTTDILPLLMKPPSVGPGARRGGFSGSSSGGSVDIPKVSNRILNALTNQVQSNLQTLQEDLANPRRIPARLNKQRSDFWKEAANVFAETPADLEEPSYTVVRSTDDYEIRDYQAYTVASTSMTTVDDTVMTDNPALQGAAFNSLAAYIFGANRQQQVLNMTTPVTTTMSGEMRFYLGSQNNEIPEPLEEDEAKSVYETDRIFIQEIPPCRLAVRRFPGFATEGEIRRQKKALLTALELDQVELDVPHGAAVSHVVFQYNPPYTFPVVRRNEIAVAVLDQTEYVEESLQQSTAEDAWENDSSSA
eukprot:scaffold1879_cov178-Amphora_coffeaeformis.AAC.6